VAEREIGQMETQMEDINSLKVLIKAKKEELEKDE
jgi:hypothetical protein